MVILGEGQKGEKHVIVNLVLLRTCPRIHVRVMSHLAFRRCLWADILLTYAVISAKA